jgi:uncharacterized protein (DUF2336 family)
MNDLITILANGSMKAVAEIAARKGITDQLDAAKVSQALRDEIRTGYNKAALDANEALNTVGEAWARKSLNLSCIEFAMRALKSCGHLIEGEAAA